MILNNALCYDCETFPNCFTFAVEFLNSDLKIVWEISHFRDDRIALLEFLQWLMRNQTFMIGFNNLNFDYPVIHFIMQNPDCTVEQIYAKAMSIIQSNDKFGHLIYATNRFIPQIDLFKIHHFDNKAKSTSLKYLQINMRTESVVDMPVENGTVLTKEQIDMQIVPYNQHDVSETKAFVKISMDAINFRISLIDQFGIDVLNWNDTKIGEQIMIQRLGDEVCYDRSTGTKRTRQTPRTEIALNNIIFPYVQFKHPEFQRVLDYLRSKVLRAEDITNLGYDAGPIKTKGVFTDLKAHVGGIDFHFGVGGIHGSLERKKVCATEEWLIRDIDVAALYPNIAIQNNLAPAHLGASFVQVYSELPKERKKWQKEKGKKCAEANSLKLAANGVYGKSNSIFSPFYDPQFTMTITVNGQLMLCMLAESLVNVPTLQILQINTDGITYFVHRDYEPQAAARCKEWETLTKLTLEDVSYNRMWLRDVNNYIAESKDGTLKLKGAYSTPDPLQYEKSISEMQPSAWHRDWSACVIPRAAVAHMVYGCDIEQFIRLCTNPFDFMHGIKVRRGDTLLYKCPIYGDQKMQRNTRYYVSNNGAALVKEAPAMGAIGAFKKANGVSDAEYARVMRETGGAWDARVCTKNQSRYEKRENFIHAGYKVSICNNASDFDFDNLNYSWYVQEALKLIV